MKDGLARLRILAAVGMAAFLLLIALEKPMTLLPPYDLAAHRATDDPAAVELTATPERPVDVPIQAIAFTVVDGAVVAWAATATISSGGAVRIRGRVPEPRGGSLRVGLVVGHTDSMPSPAEAWEELSNEGPPRPTYRILTTQLEAAP